jgi:hypothetical protein
MKFPDFVLDEEFTREVRKALGVDEVGAGRALSWGEVSQAWDALIFGNPFAPEPLGILHAQGVVELTTVEISHNHTFQVGHTLWLNGLEVRVVGVGPSTITVAPVKRPHFEDVPRPALIEYFNDPAPRAPIVREISPRCSASAPFSTLAQMGYWINQCGRRVA